LSRFRIIKEEEGFSDNLNSGFRPEQAKEILKLLGIDADRNSRFIESLPFSLNDTTAGSETELQAVVEGRDNSVDLPLIIRQSNYFKNILKRAAAGDAAKRIITKIENFLSGNPDNVWENSWVRFPKRALGGFACRIFNHDLRSDKTSPCSGLRSDIRRFIFIENGEEFVRVPVSYLLKLSLADSIDGQGNASEEACRSGERILSHFLNDNTSPETFSFHVVSMRRSTGMGGAVARETSKRFLLTQLLVMYANDKFLLKERGQTVKVYFSSLPPVRQKRLNDIISDSFYRELFMNPCLSGWDNGEEKYRYMHLCHQVLSRSRLNTLGKLREANIITTNLVALPNTSNISLANNGTHISLGSIRISSHLGDKGSGFAGAHEKYLGDLVIKMAEHFLPLFVGTYSAAPYRLDFTDFRLTPEKYHYNHTPVAGRVVDFYEIDGEYHACNPGAVVAMITPYSKNKRVVTIIDTDVHGGTRVGMVAMIEIVALMIGRIAQCYSEEGYESPQDVRPGMFVKKGAAKSLYSPGSSTDVLIFQKGRVRFGEDLIQNMLHPSIESRFSRGFGIPLAETDVKVRSLIAVSKGG
jgi:phosphatidylserine decarboxylase